MFQRSLPTSLTCILDVIYTIITAALFSFNFMGNKKDGDARDDETWHEINQRNDKDDGSRVYNTTPKRFYSFQRP